MAPELLTSEHPEFTPAVDVWGLGACLYMFVTGRPPFVAMNELELERKVRTEQVTFPRHLASSPHLKNLIVRMLHKQPSRRVSLRDVMTHEWVTREGTALLAMERPPTQTTSYFGF